MNAKANALNGKSCATAVHRGNLPFMAPELITGKLSVASADMDELKTVDVWAVLMTFFATLNPGESDPFQNYLKNIPNKVTSNMESSF